MGKSKVLWIIGGNASGKTTQSKLLHQKLSGDKYKHIVQFEFINSKNNVDKTSYTLYQNSAHVGAMRDNQCTGTDSLSTKDQIEMSYLTLMDNFKMNYVLIDGIMSTQSWVEMILQAQPDETYLVLLTFDKIEDNLKRVQERRFIKNQTFINGMKYLEPLKDKTISNVTGKWRGFYSLFMRVHKQFTAYKIIDATLSREKINNEILKLIQ